MEEIREGKGEKLLLRIPVSLNCGPVYVEKVPGSDVIDRHCVLLLLEQKAVALLLLSQTLNRFIQSLFFGLQGNDHGVEGHRKIAHKVHPLAEVPLRYLLRLPSKLRKPRMQLLEGGSHEVPDLRRTPGKFALGKGNNEITDLPHEGEKLVGGLG